MLSRGKKYQFVPHNIFDTASHRQICWHTHNENCIWSIKGNVGWKINGSYTITGITCMALLGPVVPVAADFRLKKHTLQRTIKWTSTKFSSKWSSGFREDYRHKVMTMPHMALES
jgi:hypothetical protein